VIDFKACTTGLMHDIYGNDRIQREEIIFEQYSHNDKLIRLSCEIISLFDSN